MSVAATFGFDFGDRYPLILGFAGIAVLAAVGALSHQHKRAFSAALIYLGLGALAAVILRVTGATWLDPIDDASILLHVAEFAVIVALFSTGLKLDRRLGWNSWSSVVRLLAVVMPLSIVGIALFGWQAMGLTVAGAIVLAATLAPTDPVLAGDIGVGPPGEEDEREPNFAITAEAGLNDGLAAPFVLLGLGFALHGNSGGSWFGTWIVADVLYGIAAGVWIALAAVLLIYGLTEAVRALGFLAAFVGGIAFGATSATTRGTRASTRELTRWRSSASSGRSSSSAA